MNYKVGTVVALLLVSSLLVALPWAFAAKEGLVLYLPFDGNTEDTSGNENHGKIIGKESWVDGNYGKALEFDGSTYVEIPDKEDSGFDNVSGLTIEVWVKQSTHHDNGIVVKLTSAGTWWPCSYNLETWSDQLAYFGVNQEAGVTGSYPLDEWFHLAGVFDKGNVHLYVNGELVDNGDVPDDTVLDGDLPVYVGCVEPGSLFFTGVLDEVAIYRRALSEAEIKEDMNGIVMPVESRGKLTTTWAAIKSKR